MEYPATYCNYSGEGLADASYISPNGSSWGSHEVDNISWMFEVFLESPAYRYKITKNGAVLVSQLSERVYQDKQLTSGTSTYRVQASYDGVTSGYSDTYSISLAEIQVSVDNPAGGTVNGGGLYKVGGNVTLKAVANTGYQFKGWKENGTTVSTNPNYSFTVEADRVLKAIFQKNNGVEDLQESFELYPNPVNSQLHIESSVVIRKLMLITLDGVLLDTKEVNATELEYTVQDFARGVYFIRLVTDEGVVTKKVVLQE